MQKKAVQDVFCGMGKREKLQISTSVKAYLYPLRCATALISSPQQPVVREAPLQLDPPTPAMAEAMRRRAKQNRLIRLLQRVLPLLNQCTIFL